MNNMNVIIADDHPIVLFGIRKSLEQIEWVHYLNQVHQAPFPKPVDHCSDYEQQPGDS